VKKYFIPILITQIFVGCFQFRQTESAPVVETAQITKAFPTEAETVWSTYDPNPSHLWNRVFRQLYRRTSMDGMEYGADELDPLLWPDTTYLVNGGVSQQQAIEVLDEFLAAHAEDLIHDPLKRAMFQHDLWAVFDWLASQPEPYPTQRHALATRLAQIIRSVALSRAEISSLPDNYTLEVEAHTFLSHVSVNHPEAAFLPSDIFQPDGAWVPMGREGGPIAMTHTESFPFFGRSVFLVYVHPSEGRTAALDFINALNTDPSQALTTGLEIALIRRMLLIDDQGEPALSPLVESVQLRHFSPAQNFHEFELSRARLFHSHAGGLVLKEDLFLLFMSHGDPFGIPGLPLKATIPQICKGCHFESPPLPNPSNTQSIISYSRDPFPLPEREKPILFAVTSEAEAQTVIQWKLNHETWKSLEELWTQNRP